jgi:hypothetical protein
MRYRPLLTITNGCAPLALAATYGGETLEHAPLRNYLVGEFQGMNDNEIMAAMMMRGEVTLFVRHRLAEKITVADALPTEGRGIVTCSFKKSLIWKRQPGWLHHAVAFEGKLMYDDNSDGRWQWAYDHVVGQLAYCRAIFMVKESA